MNTIEINPDDLPIVRKKVMKCKLIALNSMDKHPLANPINFTQSEKTRLISKIKELFFKSDEEITNSFNDIVNEKLLGCGCNIENYPVYVDNRFPEQQQTIDDEEPAFNQLKEDIKTNKLIEPTKTEDEEEKIILK